MLERHGANFEPLGLAVLPAFVDRLETVTIGIENVRSVITGIVIQARAGLAVVGRARRHCCLVERVHLGFALGDKADMRCPGVRIALPEPEEYAAVPSEALEVRMSFGAIPAVAICWPTMPAFAFWPTPTNYPIWPPVPW